MSYKIFLPACLFVTSHLIAQSQPCTTLPGSPWTCTKVVDSNTPRPDGQGFFAPWFNSPAIEGQWVVFFSGGGAGFPPPVQNSLWSYNLVTNQLVELASFNTPVPGGTGNFVSFAPYSGGPLLHGGMVLFFGQDAAATGGEGGLYTVPVAGGRLSKAVDYHTLLPGGGTPTGFSSMSIDRGTVVFSSQTQNPYDMGIWSATAAGSNVQRIADDNTPYCPTPTSPCADLYSYGYIAGANVAFDGGVSDVYSGLFLTPVGAPTLKPILNSGQTLPGDPAPNPGAAEQSFYEQPVIDGNSVFFLAGDPNFMGSCPGGNAFGGVFKTSLTGSGEQSVANTCQALPGVNLTNIYGSFGYPYLAANQGTAIFWIVDETPTAPHTGNLIYSSANGVLSPVISTGDTLFSGPGTVTSLQYPGTGDISGGRVVFEASSGDGANYGLYVASLACATSVANASVSLGPLSNPKPGTYSQTATVTNTGKTAITGPLSLVVANLPSGVTLTNSNGTTVCFSPPGSPYVNLPLPANDKLASGKSSKLTLQFHSSTSKITFTSSVAGPGAR